MTDMSTNFIPSIENTRLRTIDMKLEVVVIAVLNVDRAKRFYSDIGRRLDIDFARDNDFRVTSSRRRARRPRSSSGEASRRPSPARCKASISSCLI
jgi:hypothetical protein